MASEGRLKLVFHPEDSEPTLHIYAGTEGLRRLQKLFLELARDSELEVDLAAQTDVEAERVNALVLSHRETKDDFVQAVWVEQDAEGRGRIQWQRGPTGWEWCAELVPPLLDDPRPNTFQYLTQSAADDVEIELEFKSDLDSTATASLT